MTNAYNEILEHLRDGNLCSAHNRDELIAEYESHKRFAEEMEESEELMYEEMEKESKEMYSLKSEM